MKRIVFVTPEDARYGFDLTGVRQLVVDGEEVLAILLELLGDPAVGVVVLDERLGRDLPAARLADIERRWPGLLIMLPAPGKEEGEEDYLMRLVRQAIGYQVRLNL